MAAARRPTAAQVRERRARIALIVGGVLLLIVGFLQGPKLFKAISGGSSSPPATVASSTTASATAVASISPTSVLGSGQVAGLTLLKKHAAPFHSLMPVPVTTTSGQSSASGTTTTTSSGKSSSKGAANATTTPPNTPAFTTPALGSTIPAVTTPTATTSPAALTLPVTPAPTGSLAALLKVNGTPEYIGVKGTFPAKSPLFQLVSFKGKKARIEVVGGSFSNGQPYLLLAPNQKVTFVDQVDGSRIVVKFVKTTHVPPEQLTSPTQTATPSSAGATTTSSTTG